MLRESGALFAQVGGPTAAPSIDGNTITLESTLPYSAAMQDGFDGDVSVRAMIRRVRSRDVFGKMLGKNNKIVRGKIAMGIGNVAKHTRHMKIPARPFLPTAEFVEVEGGKVAEEVVRDAMRREGIK
jgi:hypothetical protein